jgi:MFS family permease
MTRLPRGAAAVLGALHLGNPRADGLQGLNDQEWRQALDFSHRSQLTLALRRRMRDTMPAWVRESTDRDAAHNLERLHLLRELYQCLAQSLGEAGIEYAALKGLTHCPDFGSLPEDRTQYDIDLFVPQHLIERARDVVVGLGFESIESMEGSPTDHIPALIRKTGWEWRGDFFDPEMPLAVELHFRFWNGGMERLPAPGTEEFWGRHVTRLTAGMCLPTLSPPDALGFASLHVLKHILHASGRPFHVYEVACFLDSHAGDDSFWSTWSTLHSPELRRLEAVAFRLAAEWFGCRTIAVAQQEMDRLPAATQAWFDEFATSPAGHRFHSRKDELWLHLSLLDSPKDAWSVARRRLFPGRLPGQVDAIYIPQSEMNWRRRLLKRMRYAAYLSVRLRRHVAALPSAGRSGVRWWWRMNSLGRQFWTFIGAAVLLHFGLFIFALLYNLYLLDLGFREGFLGLLNGVDKAGMVVGIVPAAFVVHRFGLRNTLLATLAALAVIMALRSLAAMRTLLVASAFVWGLVFAVWAVVLAPMIAGVVEEKRRPAAFSLFFATLFAVGIAGNWLGGHLPLWLHGKQPALLCAAGMVAASLLVASRLSPGIAGGVASKSETEWRGPAARRIYPRGPFLVRYLGPFALWHLATGSFNPLSNAYFRRLNFPVQQIGAIFSGSQLLQVGTVLLAPVVFRKAGLAPGIAWMMAATAIALGGLAVQASGAAAVAAYAGYMSFQWMSEPGLNTLLMNHVEERERGGASSLNYLVAFSAQAIAAFGAGALTTRFGYGVVLAGAAGIAALAAVLFPALLGSVRERSKS